MRVDVALFRGQHHPPRACVEPLTLTKQVKPWLACFYAPFWLDYYVVDIDTKDYSYIVASSPETSGMLAWMYIMTRQKNVSEEFLVPLRVRVTN